MLIMWQFSNKKYQLWGKQNGYGNITFPEKILGKKIEFLLKIFSFLFPIKYCIP